MNRPLTFRMWDVNTKRFYYLYLDELIGLTRTITIPKEATIQQYTELKDKNGVDIYEGDILQSTITDTFYQVKHGWYRQYEELELNTGEIHVFNYSHIGFFVEYNENGEACEGTLAIRNSNSVVVGNIFEHKHLLLK